MPTQTKSEIVIFKTSDEKVSIDVRFEGETVWITIDDMSDSKKWENYYRNKVLRI